MRIMLVDTWALFCSFSGTLFASRYGLHSPINFTNIHLLMDNNITVCYIYNTLFILRRLRAYFTYTQLSRISLIYLSMRISV